MNDTAWRPRRARARHIPQHLEPPSKPSAGQILVLFLLCTISTFALVFALASWDRHLSDSAVAFIVGGVWLLPTMVAIAIRKPRLEGRRRPITRGQRRSMVQGSLLFGSMICAATLAIGWTAESLPYDVTFFYAGAGILLSAVWASRFPVVDETQSDVEHHHRPGSSDHHTPGDPG